MIQKLKKISFITLPIALGVFLIWYSLSKLSQSDIQSIKTSFKTANYWWVLLSLFFGALSHLSRAYRWQFLLEPLGYKPKLANSIMSVLIAYLLNLAIPRSGEVARAASIKKYENIPFKKAFGTIVAERVADVIMLFGIIGVAFFLQTELISSYIFKDGEKSSIYSKILIFVVFPVIAFVAYTFLKKSKNGIAIKIMSFVNDLLDGVKSIFNMKKKWKFIFHTIFIWVMYVLMFYSVTFALPETTNLPFPAIIVGFVVGGLSMALTNGGLGTYPVFVASALILYNVEDNPARAFGWIMWTAQTIMVIIFGGLSFLLLPIYNKYQK
ncbi:MAG: flippase-like domain-containing protein [Lutibacter sp.]|uniref:lysylphosphatidylglycerol synthase transmembrane domain-containing protein n=1 Tax=Lutibacter sp. TaxID=1925666 RepID=UPI0017E86A60|nr:lysylphosphatidylglycerol synthase transmembrane domain-containing protein [Lutibacter sp.]MBT8318306.1 flippase-like domain-containing protein [Lutibacter sp.]NNJ59163.1 flippase-like domain-containing protein [Lutibacter sp.]